MRIQIAQLVCSLLKRGLTGLVHIHLHLGKIETLTSATLGSSFLLLPVTTFFRYFLTTKVDFILAQTLHELTKK